MKKKLLFPVCLIVSVLICTVPCFFLKLFYLYGDDYLLNYIANGSFGEEYSAHLIFLKYPLGLLLKLFYRILPSVNWYEVLLIAALALSFGVIHACILSCSRHPAAICCSLLCNAVVVPLFLTFTVASFLCACAGLALVYVAIRGECSGSSERDSAPDPSADPGDASAQEPSEDPQAGRPRYGMLFSGVLLMLLSFMLRDDCLVVAAALAFPSYVMLLKEKETRLLAVKRALAAALPLAALLAATILTEQAAYSDPVWDSFLKYNDARSLYLDSPEVNYDTFTAEYTEAGFSFEEWLLLHRWTFAEKRAFPEELFRRIADITHRAYSKRFRLRSFLGSITSSPFSALLLLPAALLLLFFLTDPSFRKAEGCLTILLLYGILFYLGAIRLRFLLRVTVPIVMCGIIFLALSSRSMSRKKLSLGFLAALSAVIVLLLVNFNAGYQVSVSSLRSTKAAGGYKKLRAEIDRHPERTYAVESPIFVYLFFWGHTIDEIERTDVFRHVFRTGSWDTFSPRYYAIAKERGIRDPENLLSSLTDTEDLFFVTEDPSYVLNFLNEEYGGGYEIAELKKIKGARVVRVEQRNPAG